MKMTKIVVIAAMGCLTTALLSFGQISPPVAKLDPEKEAMLAHYRKLHDEIRREIVEIQHAMGNPVGGGKGKQLGLEELSRLIALNQSELEETKRLVSRGESKQKVIRTKIVRVESELARALKEMPNDPVAKALQKLVEIDESASARMKKKFETGQISSDELSNAERKLAESRLELAKHQWEESAEARKALATASSALEEAVFETEMLISEGLQLEKEIAALSQERGRIDALVREETELSRRAADIQNLMGMIRSGNEEIQKEIVEGLRKRGVRIYEPGNKQDKPAEPAKEPGK